MTSVARFDVVGEHCKCFLLEAHRAQEDFSTFTLDDVDQAFDNITRIKYSQTVNLPGVGISITAYPAGHMIGGSVWRITKDGENVVYAVDYNHRREWHLNSTSLDILTWPAILITDTLNVAYTSPKRREVLGQLLAAVRESLNKQANVLVLADTAGRSFELLQVLDQLAGKMSGASQFFFVGACTQVVMDTVTTMVDFLSDGLQAQMNEHKAMPFRFPNIKRVQSLDAINAHPGPKVVVTAELGLEAGFSRQLFAQWAANPDNAIIFTRRPDEDTLAHSIYHNTAPDTLQLRLGARVELEGEELEAHRAEREMREHMDETAAASDAAADGMGREMGMDVQEEQLSSDDEDHEPYERHDLLAFTASKAGPVQRRRNAVFPEDTHTMDWDDYGLKVDMSRYRIEVVPEAPEPAAETAMDQREDSSAILTALLEKPTKVVEHVVEISLKCKVHRFDVEGRTDGESMKRIMEHVKPRNLVLVQGPPAETKTFAEFCQSKLGIENIVTPAFGRPVEITSGRNIFQVKLREALVSALDLRRAGDYEVAWVDGVMAKGIKPAAPEGEGGDGEGGNGEGGEDADAGSLTSNIDMDAGVPELGVDEEPEPHDVVFVGDLRLSDFKRLLIDEGYEPPFSSR
ncbi:hypothetical protein PTSG_02804 [Salpingoeca rosetta]|uniref:Cleavage and polyadenylation specificity factor subunit 2 n=1 Tax=Salpingoeca rosetta (strain ATCC 50818 / BSB-021) TaxID=946362 RepID=F2U3D6_SALR5|nr:uncharacterized protein PTSG_02804 [Salpingoeca rosetta]EGD82130.1 hypothetical protein PTSG_02804 [Salpingoeca rosetta]|eukprot:XP_004996313.1 hypothetical protein PTSG_02804 [Salpingoeca rosetta]